MGGLLNIVGLGPGSPDQRTPAAAAAVREADLVVGYTPYLAMASDLCAGKETFGSSMRAEEERADYAVRAAREGRKVAVVASGDACVYGIGGLVLERLNEADLERFPVRVVPGITAANAAAALLGAPFMNDYMVLSLSDLLTDRKLILRRIRAAADGDLALALYNPQSRTRRDLLAETRKILLESRPGATPVGIVRSAYRDGQEIELTTLGDFEKIIDRVDMFSLVVIGNSRSVRLGQLIITPRGYARSVE